MPSSRLALQVSHLCPPLLAAASLGSYLLASRLSYRVGYPLDDAWIHQTYARSLAFGAGWTFVPGQSSAGSTAPLWSGLLAGGHVLGIAPVVWTTFLGWMLLWTLAVTAGWVFRRLCPEPMQPAWALWVGVLLVLEWHLVWAAGSGMETLLFALLVLLALGWLAGGKPDWLGFGLLVGLCVWVRPDGITLLGPAFAGLWLYERNLAKRLKAAGLLGLGLAALFLPYLAFNRALAGDWLPNTYFAKQAEYAVLRQAPLWRRFLAEAGLPLVGVGMILLPGFANFLAGAFRRRAWGALLGAAWLAGTVLLYAWRLPVTYQHGRYLIPAMPVFFVWGFAGLASWVLPAAPTMWKRALRRAWLLSAGLVLILFWFMGAQSFGRDVAIIESEMVDTAHWVANHCKPDALVAAHDIGALGYFGNRPLLDLAGLISPDVIPFIRDEARLAAYLDSQGADYLVTFPEWYPALVARSQLIYASQAGFSPAAGGENMAVYTWRKP